MSKLKSDRVTRRDVAERAQVSPAVVSYVINNSNYVSPSTRERVLTAIAELGYKPNRHAQGLKTQKSHHILLIGNDIRNSFFSSLAYQMERFAYAAGYNLVLANAGKHRAPLVEDVAGYYDGLVIFSDRIPIRQINEVAEYGVPVLFAGNRDYPSLDPGITQVDINVRQGMKMLVRHLLEKGHREIGLFTGLTVRSKYDQDYRLMGYVEELRANGIAFRDELVQVLGERGRDALGKSIDRLLKLHHPPTAIICSNDSIAMQTIRVLHEKGLSVPGNIAVVGFGNFPESEYYIPSITSVGVSIEDLAQKLLETLLERISGSSVPRIELKRTLWIREST